MAKRNATTYRVVCEQNITPEWAQELIRRNLPALREIYRKALENKRLEQAKAQAGQAATAGEA